MNKRKNLSGFSLVELLIVIAIIGIIAGIAVPAYQEQIRHTRRAAAGVCMLELSQWMERFYTTNMSYAAAVLPGTACQNDLANFYAFAFNAAPTATTYSIDAVPAGPQVADVCGTLNIDQAGTKTPNPTARPECWR